MQSLENELTKLKEDVEVIFINDGSTDNSLVLIKNYCGSNITYKYLDLSRNFGHQIAVTAGIDHALGNKIVLMDADGQDPPSVIHEMLAKMEEGYDMVIASRYYQGAKSEDDSLVTKFGNWLMKTKTLLHFLEQKSEAKRS